MYVSLYAYPSSPLLSLFFNVILKNAFGISLVLLFFRYYVPVECYVHLVCICISNKTWKWTISFTEVVPDESRLLHHVKVELSFHCWIPMRLSDTKIMKATSFDPRFQLAGNSFRQQLFKTMFPQAHSGNSRSSVGIRVWLLCNRPENVAQWMETELHILYVIISLYRLTVYC